MHAVSIDWAKLDQLKKREYFDDVRRNRRQYYVLIREWETKNGPKRSGDKQIKELEERRKKSIVSFLTHGMEFNKAAVFGGGGGGQGEQPSDNTTAAAASNGLLNNEIS